MCSTILGLMKIDWRPKDSLDMLFCSLKRWKKGEKIDVSQYLNRRAVRLPCPQDLQMVNCSKKFQIDRRSEEREIKHKSQHQRHWNSSHRAMGSPSSLLRTKKVVKQFAFSWAKDTLCLHCTRQKMRVFSSYIWIDKPRLAWVSVRMDGSTLKYCLRFHFNEWLKHHQKHVLLNVV